MRPAQPRLPYALAGLLVGIALTACEGSSMSRPAATSDTSADTGDTAPTPDTETPDVDDVGDVGDVSDTSETAETGDTLEDSAGLDAELIDDALPPEDSIADTPEATDDTEDGDSGPSDTEDTGDAEDGDSEVTLDAHDLFDTDDGDADDTIDTDDGDTHDTDDTDTGDTDGTTDTDDGDTDDGDTDDGDTGDTIDTDDGDTVGPVTPFDDLVGLTGDALRLALAERIGPHTRLGYSPGIAREVMFSLIDARDGRVECVYTGRTVRAEDPEAPPLGSAALPAIDTTPDDDCRHPDGRPVAGGCFFNTEHSWPRSQGADDEPAASDLHHLFSTWETANNRRSNFPFGVTTCVASACTWHEGDSELGTDLEGRTVFEVRPRYRGDIARAQFYFAVRYGRPIADHTEATLRAWHLEDPPDAIERARNDAIEVWQGNRNPFIDRPDFVDALFDF